MNGLDKESMDNFLNYFDTRKFCLSSKSVISLKPGFHSNAIACVACVAQTKTARNASAYASASQ